MTTRERIVDAAARVMRELGLARATTREIARAAGLSEGAIYKHFTSKEELFLAVISERIAPFVGLMEYLPRRAGGEPIADVLLEVTRAALVFYGESFEMSASVFAEPRLLALQRETLRARGAGPQKAVEILAAYLEAERRLGHLREDADVDAAALLLIGACSQHAFLAAFWGENPSSDERDRTAASLVQTLLDGLLPLPG